MTPEDVALYRGAARRAGIAVSPEPVPDPIMGMFRELPPAGSVWSLAGRARWLAAMKALFQWYWPDPNEDPTGVRETPE